MQTIREFRPDPINPARLVPYVENDKGVLIPVAAGCFPGSQEAFLKAPEPEVLYAGARAPGKTWALLADFAQGVGQGLGPAWNGLLIRRTMDRHREIISIGNDLFPRIFPGVAFNIMKSRWDFPDGARLTLGSIDNEQDYFRYHGSSYPWIGVDELTEFEKPDLYVRLLSLTGRITGMPSRIRCTANSYMAGQVWVRDRFHILQMRDDEIVGPLVQETDEAGNKLPARRCIKGYIAENPLISSDYISKLAAAATCEAERKAWINNDWSVSPGSPLGDVWADNKNEIMCPRFLGNEVPASWAIRMSFDWGGQKPFCAGWFAVSDGTDAKFADGSSRPTVRGDTYLISELYGWTGKKDTGLRSPPREIANRFFQHEQARGYHVVGRVADTNIFADQRGDGITIAKEMAKAGMRFDPADKASGTRLQGIEILRSMMKAAHCDEGSAREWPGFFVIAEDTPQWLRTVPSLPASRTDFGDVDSQSEDHLYDMTRYFILADWTPNFSSRRIDSGNPSRRPSRRVTI